MLCILTIWVILPAVVQKAVDAGQMSFSSVTLLEPQGYSVQLAANGSFTGVNTHGFGGTMEPATMAMLYQGTQLGTFPTSPISIGPDTNSFSIQSRLTVSGTF